MKRRDTGSTPHVALLRGINVGGKNVIPMRSLAQTFERLGFEQVQTYIASGNVLFRSADNDARGLEVTIERALTKAYRYDATVVVKSKPEMAAVLRGLPRAWKKPDPAMRRNVIFLRHEIDERAISKKLEPKPEIEQIWYRPGVVYWESRFEALAQSRVARLTAQPIYKQLTIRNLNTTLKLCALIAAQA